MLIRALPSLLHRLACKLLRLETVSTHTTTFEDELTSYLPEFVTTSFSRANDSLQRQLGRVTWGPFVAFSRKTTTSLFARLENGTLILRDMTTGIVEIYGQDIVEPPVKLVNGLSTAEDDRESKPKQIELTVHRATFWIRSLLFADIGFAESFMLGECECSDLTEFFKLYILNRHQLANATTLTSAIAALITRLAKTTNTLTNALLNVQAHYDISNDMFAAFLSPDMTYSCAIWESKPGINSASECLEDAQMRKLHHIIKSARIQPSDHVLEIGTGWGSFAIEAVRTTGCRVTSLTLSIEQKALAEDRITAAGYADKVEVLLMDYRALPTPPTLFDKIVSIEMIENVGHEFLRTYFECVNRLLKTDGGIATFQCITMPEARYDAYVRGEDFIRKYIFPGGHLPSISQLIENIRLGSQGGLVLESLTNIGGHYAKTLRLWREEFILNFDSKIRPALKVEHQNLSEQEIEVFRKKWEYYFAYCEAGFATKSLGDVIITVGREGCMELMAGIPL